MLIMRKIVKMSETKKRQQNPTDFTLNKFLSLVAHLYKAAAFQYAFLNPQPHFVFDYKIFNWNASQIILMNFYFLSVTQIFVVVHGLVFFNIFLSQGIDLKQVFPFITIGFFF